MPSSTSDAPDLGGPTLEGPRSDFIASLGRKVDDVRELIGAFERAPSVLARDELRRRLHALRSGARLLQLDAMAASLDEALAVLERASQGVELGREDVAFVSRVLDDIPALACGESQSRPGASLPTLGERAAAGLLTRVSTLLVGGPSLASDLDDGPGSRTDRSSANGRTTWTPRSNSPERMRLTLS